MSGYSRDVLPLLFAFRVCNALVTHTYFNPDEYWQGPEVAHSLVFGNGYRTWEWQQDAKIRSFIHPILYVPGYLIVEAMGGDGWPIIGLVPKVTHAFLASVLDFTMYMVARRQFGVETSQLALGLWLTNWFSIYCSTRAFSNNLEACFTMIGLFGLYSIRECDGAATKCWWISRDGVVGCFAALSCYIRPTAVLFWAPVLIFTIVRQPVRILSAGIAGMSTLAVCVTVDSWLYGGFTVPAWNFVKFNGIYNVARLYGTHPWYWYLVEGVPMVVGTQLPLLAVAVVTAAAFPHRHPHRKILALVSLSLWYIGCMSTMGHKEPRFLLPVLPVLTIATAAGVTAAFKQWDYKLTLTVRDMRSRTLLGWLVTKRTALCSVGVVANIIAAVFLCCCHQRGAVAVTELLASIGQGLTIGHARVHFWMSCHSTPYLSVIHSSRWQPEFIPCSVWDRLKAEQNDGWLTPSDEFELDPEGFLDQRYTTHEDQPEFVVVSSKQQAELAGLLSRWQYREVARLFQSVSDVTFSGVSLETVSLYSKGSCAQYSHSCPSGSQSTVHTLQIAFSTVCWCFMIVLGCVVVVISA